MEDLWLSPFSSRPTHFCGRRRGLPVLAHGVPLHAWGLRLRGAAPRSRFRVVTLLPSLLSDAVGSPKQTISELNTQPTDSPVHRLQYSLSTIRGVARSNASSATSRSPSHGSGPGWLATPSLYDFFTSLLHAGLSRRYPEMSLCATTTTPPKRQPSRLTAISAGFPPRALAERDLPSW